MLIRRREGSRHDERCPYCHDSLGSGRVLACEACGAAYHGECSQVCVTLGCKGRLTVRSSGVTAWDVLAVAALVGVPITVGLLLSGIQTGEALVIGAFFHVVVGLIMSASAPSPERTVVRRDPVPAPIVAERPVPRAPDVEGSLADLERAVGGLPSEAGGAPPPDPETRVRQQEALRARHRPGLGRTI
jgi:hypothetical protein